MIVFLSDSVSYVYLCGVVLVCVELCSCRCLFVFFFFFQAEDGIRDLVRSRGLGDVYKRQGIEDTFTRFRFEEPTGQRGARILDVDESLTDPILSLIHI